MPEPINIPNELKIENDSNTFKCKLKDNNYSFRCKYRKACNILIIIKLEELKKFINKEINIQYEITSTNKNHKCKCILQNEE